MPPFLSTDVRALWCFPILLLLLLALPIPSSSFSAAHTKTSYLFPQQWNTRSVGASSKKRNAIELNVLAAPFSEEEIRAINDKTRSPVDDMNDGGINSFLSSAEGSSMISDTSTSTSSSPIQRVILDSHFGPRALLMTAALLYGTNCPLGSLMNDALPASAATSARMVLASVALSPFLFKLDPSLSRAAILCGSFTALGYISQSLALIDTAPSTVSFLGAATVIVCPALEWLICKKPMGLRDAPQTWAAAALCLMGVGVLEFYHPGLSQEAEGVGNLSSQVGWGDALALLQAVGFGTSFFLTRRMVQDRPDQTLPVTAVQVSVTSLYCAAWCFADGWMELPDSSSYTLPGLFLEGGTVSLSGPAMAIVWTGLVTTALTRMVETTALGKVSSAEASVLLAKEPLWAAAFAAWFLHSNLGMNDYIGGSLIVLACLANSLQPSHFLKLFGDDSVEPIPNTKSQG